VFKLIIIPLLLLSTITVGQSKPVTDSIASDTFLPYKPYTMHTAGIQVRSRYAYMLEYNFRGIPHTEIKVEGGTADHTHYNLMGFSTTKTTGRYAGIGVSFLSTNYYKPVKTYRLQHGFVASFSMGLGTLHFLGEKEFPGNYYPSFSGQISEENVPYQYTIFRLGYEVILDRVIRFDIYPVQFTNHSIIEQTLLDHQYIPAIGVTRNGSFNPGFGVHIVLNQIKKKKK